ncbi:hypothetical protein GIB67_042304 [Kingdonia uniflora]|uniref:RRM domain-containing protein n=1 Tax=Kingdonia uniflora TaxID=39325 RepID=A0A7J7LDZ0_9MAGN|nr:hypothetical protein GIB67_042304 [Kingdonia uniflora]
MGMSVFFELRKNALLFTPGFRFVKQRIKIIMDRISKKSKGYAFLEYTTEEEEAAGTAVKEMNDKVI